MKPLIECPVCAKWFIKDKNAKKYCSAKCRRKANRAKITKAKEEEVYYCQWCGKEFTGRKRKYCCEECRLRANGKKVWERTTASKIPFDGLTFEQADRICKQRGISYGEFTRLKMMNEVERGRENDKENKV